jgi:hypothetical protein
MATEPPAPALVPPCRTSETHLSPPDPPNATSASLHSSPRISPLPTAHLPDVEKPAASLSAGDDAWTLYDPDLDPDKDERGAADARALSILVSFLASLSTVIYRKEKNQGGSG